MCWVFADTWLEEPAKHTHRHKTHRTRQSIPFHHRKKGVKRYVYVEPGSQQAAAEVKQQQGEKMWEYIPAEPEKLVSRRSSRKQDVVAVKTAPEEAVVVKPQPKVRIAGDVTKNEWEYMPTASDRKSTSKKSSKKYKIVTPAPAAAPSAPPAAQPIQYYQPPAPPAQQASPAPYMQCYPQIPYGYAPQYAYPAPAYYGYPQQQQPAGMPYCPPGYTLVQAPAAAPPAEVKPAKSEPRKWQGRTKGEVEEDNMKIAQREGAYDARKVQPVELKEDQIVWCVETDQSHTLRTFAAIQDLKGEWKKDPRFPDSWYFVREK